MLSKVLPFRGLIYNPAQIDDWSKVVSPPYDVITPEAQAELYQRSPYNFVRVDLAREEERYQAAKKVFEDWRAKKIFIQDEKPALYFHHQTYALPDGKKVTRKGFFGIRKIEEFSEGGIKPHEKTLEGPKADRLKLTRALSAQLSPVFSLYADPEGKIDHLVMKLKETTPFIAFETTGGEAHQVWREVNPVVCQFVSRHLSDQPLFIADGHHRYETALAYRDECLTFHLSAQGTEPFNYVLMYFVNLHDEGLVILPIHRSLHHLKNFDLLDFVRKLQKHFKVAVVSTTDDIAKRLAEEGEEAHAFAVLTKDPQKSYLISLSKRGWRQHPVALTLPPSLVELDVSVLHRLIFQEILKITPEAEGRQENIVYWKDQNKAVHETRSGRCEITFLLNPTKIGDVSRVAMAGETMPQKSTYFYPKVLSGLLVHLL